MSAPEQRDDDRFLSHAAAREETARYMRRLYERGLTTASGGNLSRRCGPERIALTGSKFDKSTLTAEQVCVLKLGGANLTPRVPASIEAEMHLAIYRVRPEVRAIVHAHPVTATAFAACGAEINCRLVAEAYALLGRPTIAPYACMGTPELARCVAEAAAQSVCIVLTNHGILTLGGSLFEAFDRLELVEIAARTTLLARQLGGGCDISPKDLADIDVLMGRKEQR